MAQPFQNIGQRPFEAQNFRRNFGNNFDTVVVSGFSRYIRAKQIVDFFTLKEGDCVCVSTKSNPPSVLLRFSSPVVAQKVVLMYNNSDVYGQKLEVFPSNNWHSISPQSSLQSAEIPPLMRNNARIPTPNTPSRRVQAPSLLDVQPMVGTSILNLAKALLIQKNNLENRSFVQRKSRTRSPQRNFPPSRRSPPGNQQRNADRRGPWRPSDNRTGSVKKKADKDSPTGNRSDKNTVAKKQETAQKVSDTEKCPKDQSIKRNQYVKGPVIRRKRLKRRSCEKDIVSNRNSERTTQTAVSKGSSGVMSSADRNMDKSDEVSLQKTSQDMGKEKNCSTNSNRNNETGTKATIEKHFDGCKINTEGNAKTKRKEDEASSDGVKSKSTAKENPASQGIGSKKECPTRINDKKDKIKGGDKTIPKDSVIENEKPAGGMKDKSGKRGSQEVTQGTGSKQECPTRKNDDKDKEGYHTPTRKDSVIENESPKGSIKNKSGEKSTMSSERETKCPMSKSNDTDRGKRDNKITKKDSIIENESTGDGVKNKGRETEVGIKLANNDKKCSCDVNKNTNIGSECRPSTSKSGSEKKDPSSNINDAQGKQVTASTNDNKSQENVKGGDIRTKNFGSEKNSSTGNVNVKNNSRTTQDSSGNKGPIANNDKRNAETRSEIVSTQNKSANNSRSSFKTDPQNSNVKNRSQTVKNLQNFPDGKKPSLENQHKKDDGNQAKGEKTESGLKKTSDRSLSKDNKLRQANDSRTAAQRNLIRRNSTASNLAENKDSLSDSRQPNTSRNMENGGKANPKSSVSKDDAARKRYYRFMINARDDKHDSSGRNHDRDSIRYRKRLDESSPRPRSFSPYRNRISPPRSRDDRMFEGNRSPDRTPLRNNPERSSDDIRTKKRAFEATGLVVAPPKRKCLDNKSTGCNNDKMDPKKVIDTTFEVTGLVVAPPTKMCLDDQSTGGTDTNGPEKVGSPNELVPKKVIDTTFKATGLVVAPPKGRCLDNKSAESNNDKMGPKRVFGLKDLRNVVIEKNSEKSYGTLKGQKISTGNNNQKGGDGIRRGKESDAKNISTRKDQECKDSSPVEISAEDSNLKRSDCLNLDKGQTAGDALKNSDSIKDSSKNLEDKGLAITKTSAKDASQESGDGSNLVKVQVEGETLKTSETSEDLSMQKKPEDQGSNAAKTCTNSDKLQLQGIALKTSNLMKDSSNNSEKEELTMTKCSSEQNHQRSSDGTNLVQEKAGDELKDFRIRKESSTQKKPEDNGFTIAKNCSEYNCQKISDGTNLGKVEPAGDAMKFFDSMKDSATRKKSDVKGLTIINSSVEQNVQRSSDGSGLYKVQVAGDSLKNSNTPRDRETSPEKSSSKRSVFPKGDNQNKIKESDNPARESPILIKQGHDDMNEHNLGKENQLLVKQEQCVPGKCDPDNERQILMKQEPYGVEKHPSTSTVNREQGDDSLEKDPYSKIPVSPCTSVLSLYLSINSENSSDVEGEHTTTTERNSDTCKASLAADIMQRKLRNMTNNGNDKLKCSSPNTGSLKDSIKKDIDVEAGDRDQMQDENFEQERNPLKGDVEENTCHVDQISQGVGAFSTVITFMADTILTESDQSENENINQSESLPIPKISDKESLKDDRANRNVLENQEPLPTVSKTVPSKKTTLGKTSGLSNSRFMLAKLKSLKTNAQKTFRTRSKANVATSEAKSIYVKINSALNSCQQENENSDESLSTNPNSAFESKSVNVEDRIVKSAENQSGLATVSKYFACEKNAIDQKSDAGVSDDKLKPGLMEISGSNKDCSNSNHKSTDEEQPVITCDSAKKADDNFPNSTPANNILPELEGVTPNISTLSQKSLIPQSGRIRVAKNDGQNVDKGENEENQTQKSAEPKDIPVGTNVPDNMQRPVESRTRIKGIDISVPEALSASISETVKEGKTSEVFSQENTSNVVSEEHITEQHKVVCGSSETKSSSTCGVAFLGKSTTSTIAPALLATEEVKRFKTDVPVTEDHPMCVTNSSEKYFHSLSTIDLQNNNTRIASIRMSDVKQETQVQNEPTSAKDNSSFQSNASENNQGKELTNVTCDSLSASESGPQVSESLALTTITHTGSGIEQVKRVKIEKTSPPKDNLERNFRVDIFERPNCDSMSSDKTTPSSENPTSTTSTVIWSDFQMVVKLNIEETLTKNDQEYSIDDKRLDCDFQKDNLGSSKNSVSTSNVYSNSSATTNTEMVCSQGTIMPSAKSSVKKGIINTNIVKNESKERYLDVDGRNFLKKGHIVAAVSIEKNPIPVIGETGLVRCSSTNTYESKEHLIQEDRQDVLKNSQNGVSDSTDGLLNSGSNERKPIPVLGEAELGERFSTNTSESNEHLIQGYRQDVLKKSQNVVGDSTDGFLNAVSIERNPMPVLGEPRLVWNSSTNSRDSKDILIQGDTLNGSIKYENITDCSSETLLNLASMERNPIPVLGEPRLDRSSSTNALESKEYFLQRDRQDVLRKSQNDVDSSTQALSISGSNERNPIPILGETAFGNSANAQSFSQGYLSGSTDIKSNLYANIENQSLPKPSGTGLQNHTRKNNQSAGVNAQGEKTGKRKRTRRKEGKNKRKKRLRRMQNQQPNQGTEDNVQRGKALGNNGSVQQQLENKKCKPESLKQVFRMRCKDYMKNVGNFAENLSQNESNERLYYPVSQVTQEIVQEVFQSGCLGDMKNDGGFGESEKGVSQNGSRSRLKQTSQEEVTNNDGNLVQNGNGVSQHDIEQNVNCSSQSTQVVLKHASQNQSSGDAIKQAFQTVFHGVNNDEKLVQNVQSTQEELKLSSQIGCQKVNSGQNSVQSDICHDFNNASDGNYAMNINGNENGHSLVNKDLQSGCHNANSGNSVQSGVGFSDNGSGQNLNYPSASCEEILNQASQSGCQSLSNGGSSVQNDGQDVNNGNLTGDTAIAGKRKREDEPADLAGNKHQKCQNPNEEKNLNEVQSNQSNKQAAGVEGVKLSRKERRGQKQERWFLWKNLMAIEEQYDKESIALLKNVKMLASMDPSLTEKLKGAFKDSLAEIGRKLILDLHKLKEKNDSYKNQHKLAKGNNVPQNNPKNKQGTVQGKTQNQQKMAKAKMPQSKPNAQQKKGKGNVHQKNPMKTQKGTGKAVDNGQINNQKMAKGKMAQIKSQKKSQMKGNMPQNGPQHTRKGDNCQRNPTNQYNMIKLVGQIGPTNKQNMPSGNMPLCWRKLSGSKENVGQIGPQRRGTV